METTYPKKRKEGKKTILYKLVSTEYDKLLAEEEKVPDDVKLQRCNDVLRKRNEKLARYMKYCKEKNLVVPQWRIDPNKYRSTPSNTMVYYYMDNHTPVGINVRYATPITTLPPSKAFAIVNRNIRAPDEYVLHNIPNVAEKDMKALLKKLDKPYKGVHGDGGKHPSNELFVKFVDILLTHQKIEKENYLDLFEAISDYFMDYGSADELLDRYNALRATMFPDYILPYQSKNVDGPDAENIPPKRALHSYNTIFCRMCYTYECFTHIPSERPKLRDIKAEYICEEKLLPDKPCSSQCYLTLPNMIKRVKKLRRQIYKNALENTRQRYKVHDIDELIMLECCEMYDFTETEELDNHDLGPLEPLSESSIWHPADCTLFKVLRKIFKNNFCAIKSILVTKTCLQIFEMAQTEEIESSSRLYFHIKDTIGWGHKGKPKFAAKKFFDHYQYCEHPNGKCDENCLCVKNEKICEKFCICDLDCEYRFKGCRCRSACNTTNCVCFKNSRECDPDLCKGCHCGDMDVKNIQCLNVNLLRGSGVPLLLAPSAITGWGIFTQRAIRKYGFIAEYCGEVITNMEADRRGVIYDYNKVSYLFNLDAEYVVDAMRKGSLLRFANHKKRPNCKVAISKVCGNYRIGVYAANHIAAGEEIFISYQYKQAEEALYLPK